jgi:hypothetical protein
MPDPDETQRFDALLDAMLTKPGPDSPSEDLETDQDDVKDGEDD